MIPLYDLTKQYSGLRKELHRAAARVLDSGRYILGPEVAAFEREFAQALRVRRAIAVANGTDALKLSLEALGIGAGDEVIVPAFTFIATANAVSAAGATPVFADIDRDSFTIAPKSIAQALTSKTRAILPVHLYGASADMDAVNVLARRRRLKVVEDCAQSHLTTYKGRMVGALGDLGAFSFYPSKNLGAMGDAGAIVTDNPKLASTCVELRNAGRRPDQRYDHSRVGHNSRLDELQAAFLRIKLARLAGWTENRRRAARLYSQGLAGLPLRLPDMGSGGTKHSFHLYVIRSSRRDSLAEFLTKSGVGNAVYYPVPLHRQPAYRFRGYRAGDFPEAERASREVLSLPMFPEITPAQIAKVCRAVSAFFRVR